MARPRIKDVAAAAGVSVATVSRALSGARGVRPEHKEAVQRAATRLGYQPHAIAQALREARTRTIGMVVPRVDNPFFPQLVQLAEERLQERGLGLLLCSANDDPTVEATRLRMLADRRVDGLLVSACSRQRSAAAITDVAARVPTVQFDRFAPFCHTAFVGVDDESGIHQVADHAHAAGRTRLAYIGGSDENWSGHQRREGFQQWAHDHDRDALDRMQLGEFTRAFGRAAALDLYAADRRIDAFICGNDLIALGVLDAAKDLQLSVPDDVALTGYDDTTVATVCQPNLTTVQQPVELLVQTAIDLLLRTIEGEDTSAVHDLLPVTLVSRGSI